MNTVNSSSNILNSNNIKYTNAAEELGKRDRAYEIRNAKPKMEQTTYYDENNLTQTRTKSLQIIK